MRWLGVLVAGSCGLAVVGMLLAFAPRPPAVVVSGLPRPRAECQLPPARCAGDEATCAELVRFAPAVGPGYVDWPQEADGESWAAQHASYLRRDLMIAVQHAAAAVACRSARWRFGQHAPIALLDMSEADGATPGTRDGAPGHPRFTHERGLDIDVTYYQIGTGDNRLRSVCVSRLAGRDAQHCLGEPDRLDPWRTALFVGTLLENPRVRVIGVDGRVGPVVLACLAELCRQGWLSADACVAPRLAFDREDRGRGWFYSHHNHMHVSWAP